MADIADNHDTGLRLQHIAFLKAALIELPCLGGKLHQAFGQGLLTFGDAVGIGIQDTEDINL